MSNYVESPSFLIKSLLVLAAIVSANCPPVTVTANGLSAGFHYMAADASLRYQVQNTTVVMGQATNMGPVLSLNQSWEAPFYLNYPGSIVTDPATGQWRMYYELIDSSARPFIAM